MSDLDDLIPSIDEPDGRVYERVRDAFNERAKPPNSLGRLEEAAARYGRVHGTVDLPPVRMRICTFAADHGVVEEGVSGYPQEVTAEMVELMEVSGAAINVLAHHAGADHRTIDLGTRTDGIDPDGDEATEEDGASANFTVQPAMSTERTTRALEKGVSEARSAVEQGFTLLGTGDLGIGNTTVSAALLSVLLDLPVNQVVGRGAGADDETMQRKVDVIQAAIDRHQDQLSDPFRVLQHLGGPELAGLTGFILGAASERTPVVIDGLPTTAAAVVGRELAPAVGPYLFWSHRAGVRGHKVVLDKLDVEPLLDLGMRLGEGTGAALAGFLVDGAVKLYRNMADLSEVLPPEGGST